MILIGKSEITSGKQDDKKFLISIREILQGTILEDNFWLDKFCNKIHLLLRNPHVLHTQNE